MTKVKRDNVETTGNWKLETGNLTRAEQLQRLYVAVCAVLICLTLSIIIFPIQQISSQEILNGSWQPQKSGVLARLSTVYFTDENTGWIGGSSGTLLYTEDGGESWQRRQLPEAQSRETVRDIRQFGASKLLLLGEYGMLSRRSSLGWVERIFILASPDLGRNWAEMKHENPPVTESPARIIKKSEKETILEPGKLTQSPDPVLLRFSFANDVAGWACGEGGTIQATTNGGASWQMQKTKSQKLLYDVLALDSKSVWVVGAGGTILNTKDGGTTWDTKPSGVSEVLRAVDFTDDSLGWVAGSNGTVLVTFDGGETWQKQNTPTKETLNDILFLDAEGWAAGDGGTLLYTKDGGKTWQDESLKTHANLTRLFFISNEVGWVVGSNGALYKYNSAKAPEK